MTQLEKRKDENELMNLEMMDSITGGALLCKESCLIACTESCILSKKVSNTDPTTSTPDPTEPTSES